MSRWLALLPLAVLAGLAALFAGYALHRNPQVTPMALVGKPMPDLALPSLDDGQPQRLAEALRDGPVLVNFYASWCAPCRIEHPMLLRLQAQGVRIVGVAYKDAPADSRAFLDRLGDPFIERLADRDGRAGIDFGVSGVPETYLVGRDGRVAAKYVNLDAANAQALRVRLLTLR
jgi:cytochrome c biogenesis protein CcmG/thiol:disulfide interchange protein DsbE